jgi:xanthine dehydrogenase YagS FAD-binding subunit
VVGELCRRPACWYFRNGHGLLADGGQRVVQGDNRYHAILGNDGPAKFVSASRLAPALVTLGAHVRVIGPGESDEMLLPVEDLYRTPEREGERETTLMPGQVITHLILPPDTGMLSATYEVRHGMGPDPPLAAAAVTMFVADGLVRRANICLGHVAPVPWTAGAAARRMVGHPVNEHTAREAGLQAVAGATPLSENAYKVQLAAVAVQRAILTAIGQQFGEL